MEVTIKLGTFVPLDQEFQKNQLVWKDRCHSPESCSVPPLISEKLVSMEACDMCYPFLLFFVKISEKLVSMEVTPSSSKSLSSLYFRKTSQYGRISFQLQQYFFILLLFQKNQLVWKFPINHTFFIFCACYFRKTSQYGSLYTFVFIFCSPIFRSFQKNQLVWKVHNVFVSIE